MSTVGNSNINDIPHRIDTSNRAIGLDGYGKRKHPTRWMVKIPGSDQWRRVWSCCISNAGTCYVLVGKNWHTIDGDTPKTERLT